MADLTPAEQEFFSSGGDTSKLGLPNSDPGVQGVEPIAPPAPALDLAGLGGDTPPAPAPAPAAPVAPPVAATPAPAPAPDQTEFLRTTLAQTQQQAANLAAQIEALKAAQKPPELPIPDPTTDPLGNMLHQLDAVNKRVADMQANLSEQQNQQQQLSAFQRFQQQIQTLRDQFQVTNPDFQDAYSHLRNNRMADLRQFGIPEADIARQIFQEEVAVSQAAISLGKNPASEIYEMAKRHGYQKSATAPAPATPAPTANKLDAVKAGLTTNPSNLPRTPINEELSVEALRAASDADLNKLVTDPNAWAKIAGSNSHPI